MTEDQYISALERFKYLNDKDIITVDEHIEYDELCFMIQEYENKTSFIICLN